jgi:protein-S-isoprenylcysteine O-methyltransferase Ste14
MYVRLAKAEEREAVAEFGDAYRNYMKDVPGFVPNLRGLDSKAGHEGGGSGRS